MWASIKPGVTTFASTTLKLLGIDTDEADPTLVIFPPAVKTTPFFIGFPAHCVNGFTFDRYLSGNIDHGALSNDQDQNRN